ncbi:MAG: type II CAAX endopeptidase family protein [Candidatus Diapherotrites archaeon]
MINAFLIEMAFDALLIGLPLLFFIWQKLSAKGELGLKPNRFLKDLTESLLLFVALFVSSIIISILLSMLNLNDLVVVKDSIKTMISSIPLFIVYALVVRVFAEEVFFRGFLVKRVGILWSSLAFGLMHALYGSVAEVIGAFLLGLILAWWFQKNNSLLQNYIGHFLYNCFIIAILVLS